MSRSRRWSLCDRARALPGRFDRDGRRDLNAGYTRRGSVWMCEGQGSNQQAKEWRVFCPKVFSGIGNQHLPDTLIDRSIPIEMKRKAKKESVEKFHELDAMRELEPITQRCEDLAPQLVPDRLLVAVY